MYSTYYQTRTTRMGRVAAWLNSPNIVHALGASLLVVATISVAFSMGEPQAQAVSAAPVMRVVDSPKVVTRYVDVVTADPSGWSADESASGTAPDHAH